MAFNVSCYVDGCTNPVIGQCSGYPNACGHFYCSEHSLGRLCHSCGTTLLQEKEQERIYNEYVDTVKEIQSRRKKQGCSYVMGYLALPVVLVALAANASDNIRMILLGVFVVATILIYGILTKLWWDERVSVRQMDETMPGFKDFYHQYTRQKTGEALGTILGVTALVVGGTIAGAAGESLARNYDKAQIDRAVDDELHRRGYD